MISEKLPIQLSYQTIAPIGFPSIYKEWINDPITGNKQWANNDIIRWNFINSKRGVFDPYRTFVQITVAVNQNNLPVGLLQIDNSAQSFINQLVLYSNNREVERITEYSVLAAYLNDIGITQFLTQGRQVEGLGYGNMDTTPFNKSINSANSTLRREHNAGDVSVTVSTGNIFPTIGNGYPEQVQYANQNSLFNCSKSSKGHVTNSNVITTGSDWNGGDTNDSGQFFQKTGIQASMALVGYAGNIRSDYYIPFITPKFIQSTDSIPCYQLCLDSSVGNNTYPFKYQQGSVYKTTVRQTLTCNLYYDQAYNKNTHSITTSNYGFASLFSPLYSRGTFEPFISATVPQSMMSNGKISQTKFPIYRRTFKIPLISSVIGCLVQSANYRLLPLQSINDCLLQLTLDPYAMFTSGYNDISELDDTGMMIQQKRNYIVERVQLKMHTYFFLDSQIQTHIRTSLYKQIIIVSNFWQLGNQYQIAGNQPPNNSYIVGCNSTNLNQIVCLFHANDYQNYSFCRKHFRLSNNIKRFWSKLGVDYWPPQPFKGNGGNPISNNYEDDNSIFVENIYWANGYMFGKNPLPRINIYNFAINERPYNPLNKNTYYDKNLLNNQNYAFTKSSINADTALGMSWLHENRCVGKAAYIIVYTPLIPQQGVLQGINVSGASNFQVVFESDAKDNFQRDQTLYIFCKSSVLTKYTKEGIITIGR